MLSIFIIVGIASAFSRKAFDKERNRYLWGFIGVASYFVMQVIAGIIIALVNEEWLENQGIVTAAGLLSGFLGVGIAYYILNNLADPTDILDTDENLLDKPL